MLATLGVTHMPDTADPKTADAAPADPRVRRSKDAVLAQTYALLSEMGIGGVSVDEVSRRSGVAKTTIYRHWPSRAALLLDACSQLGTMPPAPDTGSPVGDLQALASQLAGELRSARWAVVLPSIIDAAERDADLAQLHGELHAQLVEPFLGAATRAQQSGDLDPGQNPADVVAAVLGPLFYRRWFTRQTLDPQFVEAVVNTAVTRRVTTSPTAQTQPAGARAQRPPPAAPPA